MSSPRCPESQPGASFRAQLLAASLISCLVTVIGARRLWPDRPRTPQPLSLGSDCRSARLSAATRFNLGLKLDLNRASAADLELLPRVGPVLARRIVQERRRQGSFQTLQTLRQVRGVGPAMLAKLRRWLCIEGATASGERCPMARGLWHGCPRETIGRTQSQRSRRD